jgi:hypothetical protein
MSAPAEAAATLVPPEVVELLGVLQELSGCLPFPADHNWERRNDVQANRDSTLRVLVDALAITVRVVNDAPDIGRKMLADHCQQWIKQGRDRLAEPLGYEPKPPAPAKASDLSTDGSLPSVYSSPGLSRG